MDVTVKVDGDLSIENGNVVVRFYDSNGDVTCKYEQPLYELVSEFVGYYQIVGTQEFKLDAEDIIEFENIKSELDDSLTLVSAILEGNQ